MTFKIQSPRKNRMCVCFNCIQIYSVCCLILESLIVHVHTHTYAHSRARARARLLMLFYYFHVCLSSGRFRSVLRFLLCFGR